MAFDSVLSDVMSYCLQNKQNESHLCVSWENLDEDVVTLRMESSCRMAPFKQISQD